MSLFGKRYMAAKGLAQWTASVCLICAASVLHAAPTDGVIFWSETDKNPDLTLSADQLTVSLTGFQWEEKAVRGNRPINPGEGFYYFEVTNTLSSLFGVGVATDAVPLNELGGFSPNMATINQEARMVYNGSFSSHLANPADTVGVAVDYRGAHPIIHFIAAEEGSAAQHVGMVEMDSVSSPIYFFLSVADHVGAGLEHSLNLGGAAFVYDPAPVIDSGLFNGSVGLTMGWPIDNASPEVTIAEGDVVSLSGANISLNASANDAESGDISSVIEWFLDGVSVGNGANIVLTPAVGEHVVAAVAEDAAELSATDTIKVVVTADDTQDHDFDGLTLAQEIIAGSNPARWDTDGDGLNDGDEASASTDPLVSDSDLDGMNDKYEIDNGLDPLAGDAAGDLDGDGFDNLSEALAQRKANDADDYPGHGRVVLNVLDAAANVSVAGDELSFSVSAGTGIGAVRSDIAILPESGWHYFEGTRLGALGNFGFGVATASAALDQAAGVDADSVGLSVNGDLTFDGVLVDSMATTDPALVTAYGIAVDYTTTTPIVHVMVKGHLQDYELLAPVTMTGVSEALYIIAYAESSDGTVQQSINAGEDKNAAPFAYSARYLLYRDGFTSAEFMRNGWGTAHTYQPLTSVPLQDRVYFVKDENVNVGLRLTEDGLGAAYTDPHKSAVLANQGMIGEFRYYEAQRHIEVQSIGYGLNNPYSHIDPYCCVNNGLSGAPPSMSLNAVGGVWRNLQYQYGYPDTANTYFYGFAVDYRSDRPTVYVITQNGVVGELTLDDFITEIYPMIYGDGMGPRLTNSANFGATPFFYNAEQALQNYGLDTSEFVPGWGIYEQRNVFGNVGPQITSTAPTAATEEQEYSYQVSVNDPDDLDVVNELTFSLQDAPVGMVVSTSGLITWTPSIGDTTSGAVTVTVADGGEFGALPTTETFTVAVALAPTPTPTPTPTPSPTATPTPTATPEPTPTPSPTATPEPTPTPDPTPTPTVTPEPTPTPTPTPGGDYPVVLVGTPGDDGIYAYSNDNTQLEGLAGSDHMVGQGGNDLFIGGPGNDTIEGGDGADIYYYNLGDGTDYIANYEETSTRVDGIVFGPDVDPNDVEVYINGNDLVLSIEPTGDTITVGFHFYNWDGNYYAELGYIQYDNGLMLTADIIRTMLVSGTEGDDTISGFVRPDVIEGMGGNDILYGREGNDFVFGNEGDDFVYGEQGDDRLGGGPGSDFLEGGPGDDTYYYNLEDGNDIINNFEEDSFGQDRNDVIAFGEGISSSDVSLSQEGGDLVITVLPTGNTVTVPYHFTDIEGGTKAAISRITFQDAVSWSTQDISDIIATGEASSANNIVGTDEDDALFGTEEDNVLVGGLGDDWMFGGEGNDEYRYSAGDGNDEIINMFTLPEDQNSLVIDGIAPADIWFQMDEVHLIIGVVGSDDSVLVYAWANDENNQLDTIVANGQTITRLEIIELINLMAAYTSPIGAGNSMAQATADAILPEISARWE